MIRLDNKLLIWLLLASGLSYTTVAYGQTDTDFWFVVPELSHRNNTGGTPGTLRISTLELEATVTISMPANAYDASTNPTGFLDIVIDIPANSASSVDLTHLIDTDALPNNNRLENKPVTPEGINNFGLHITSTNVINTYWEVNYQFGSDLWTLKGTNGLGTLFYTPFQTVYPNNNILPARAYSAIDIVATEDNTRVTFQLPAGKAASYGLNAANAIPAGGTYTTPPLSRGQTFSIYPFRFSTASNDRLAGTRVSSTAPIAVSVKDDGILTPPSGQTTVGDQIVPVSIAGDTYIVPEVQNPNHVFILATTDNTNVEVFIADGTNILSTMLNEGEQVMVQLPNGAKFARITSRVNPTDPFKPIYVWQIVGTGNQNRGGALVPPIGCTGNTQLSFTRAREGENGFYFFIITEKQNIDKFLIDGVKDDGIIPPVMGNRGFTELAGSGGWVAQITSSINANVLATGQHLVENTGGIFHLGIINGFPSAQRGALFYGFYSDFGGLNIGATVGGTNSSVVRSCLGNPVQLYAFGGTDYNWSPSTYLDDATSNMPTAYNLPAGPHDYTVEVSGACGSGEIDLTIVTMDSIKAHTQLSATSGCTPLEITFEDQSKGAYYWDIDLGEGTMISYDLDPLTPHPPPPDPFVFNHIYTTKDFQQATEYEITLLVKDIAGCSDIEKTVITVNPEVNASFVTNTNEVCDLTEILFQNNSQGANVYYWDFGDGSSSDAVEPTHQYDRNLSSLDTVYTVTLIASNGALCSDSVFMDIVIHPSIEASFTVEDTVDCNPFVVTIHNTSSGVDSYAWDFGDGSPVSTSSSATLTQIYMNNGSSEVIYSITLGVQNVEGCTDTMIRNIKVHPEITANFTQDQMEGCDSLQVNFTDLSVNAVQYLWNFGDGTSSEEHSPVHTFVNSGYVDEEIYMVELTTSTADGECQESMSWPITVYPQVLSEFAMSDAKGCGPFEVAFANLSMGGDAYTWNFRDGTTSTENSPDHTFTNSNLSNPQEFDVSLVAQNAFGCLSESIQSISVYPPSQGGILSGGTTPITYKSSIGLLSLSGETGSVRKWQRTVDAGTWEDLLSTSSSYMEIPISAGEWQYRVEVKNGMCPEAYSDLLSVTVLPKEIVITPKPGQGKIVGEADPVFDFTNSEWSDTTRFTGVLGREPGEEIGFYAYTLGDLSAGPNYSQVLEAEQTFSISAPVGIEKESEVNGLGMICFSNPGQSSPILKYTLPYEGRITLSIRSITGQVVKVLYSNKLESEGVHFQNLEEYGMDAGIYLLTLQLRSGDRESLRTIKLIKGE